MGHITEVSKLIRCINGQAAATENRNRRRCRRPGLPERVY